MLNGESPPLWFDIVPDYTAQETQEVLSRKHDARRGNTNGPSERDVQDRIIGVTKQLHRSRNVKFSRRTSARRKKNLAAICNGVNPRSVVEVSSFASDQPRISSDLYPPISPHHKSPSCRDYFWSLAAWNRLGDSSHLRSHFLRSCSLLKFSIRIQVTAQNPFSHRLPGKC